MEDAPAYIPENTFADFAVADSLKANIAKKGYELPTPIQDQAIPQVLLGKDVVGIANTGTGKTAAFLIPLIEKVLSYPKEQVLILVPTRELALQIEAELKGFTKGMRIFSVCCVGGAPMGPQLRALSYPNQFVIGTPGRVKDLIERKRIRPSEFRTVVLDEADRMLDMGFIGDMREIMGQMPEKRHTLFFSATLGKDIEKLIHDFLTDPVHIKVVTRETAENVEQDVVRAPYGEKLEVLTELLGKEECKKVLIFGRTKHGVEKLSQALRARGFHADALHGDKNQSQRNRALRAFREEKINILVATDVAARGLDIPDVSHVINYELPTNYEDYVHRIGRTGRGRKRGKALTFVDA
jgi:superfamily II DNA/RNA helicase